MATTMDVEALVAQMTENLAAIHTTIAGLSTKEHDAKLDELEEKRDALLDALLSEYEAELEELTAQRAKEEEEITETRRREDEEREARRKQEDDEFLAQKDAQDAERRDRLARETDLVEEEADEGIDAVEAEVQKLLQEGQARLTELEEKRKEINRLIDERMSNPIPTFVPRKRTRAKTADAPADIPVDTDAAADVPVDAAPPADPDTKDDASVDDAPAVAAKSAAPTNGLLAIEAAPNADALKDDDTSDKDVSLADDSTTSKDEVSFPSPAGDDSGNDVKAHEDAAAPASEEAVAERGGEDTEPAARGVDVAADAAEEDEPVAEKAEDNAEDEAEPKETLETRTRWDDHSSNGVVSTEIPEPEPKKSQDADASELNADPTKTDVEDVVQERSVSPVADTAQEPASVTNADRSEDTITNDASDAESVDDALPADDPARDLECAEKAEDASNRDQSSDEPTEQSVPAADYYHTRSPEPETRDEVDIEPTTEREISVLANDEDVPTPEEVSKSESAAFVNDNAAEREASVNSGAEEDAEVDRDATSSVPVVANGEPTTVANGEISASEEPGTAQEKDTSSIAADSDEEDKTTSPLAVDDRPAPIVEVNDDIDGVLPAVHDSIGTEDDKRTLQHDASDQKASEHADIDTSSPAATTEVPLEDDELKDADEISAERLSHVEEAPEAASAEKTIGSNPSEEQDRTVEADEVLEESEKPIEAPKPKSASGSVAADEESKAQLALSTKSVEPVEDDILATEDAGRRSGSPGFAVNDQDKLLNPPQLSATRPETELEESESSEADAAVESKDAQATTSDLTTKSMDAPQVQEAPGHIEVAAQADSIVDKVVTDDNVDLTRSFGDASSVAVGAVGPTVLNQVSESAASDSSEKISEPEVVISSAPSNVGQSMKDSHTPDNNAAGSSTYERSVGSEPNSSSPEEESFFGIPEDTALDDEADLHSGESPGIAKVSSLHGEADQSADRQPPILGNERSIPGEESHERKSRAINEPSSPLVDPDTPIPSIERDYDSSDDEAGDFEADAKYEQQRSYALPEETPEPIEATTRSPAPQTATTPSVEPFIRDLDYDDEESKVEELLSTIKPQDASVELRSAERSVSSSLDAGSAQPDDEEAFSTRDLSPADSAVDKTSIPDYYNTRSRSPTRVSEKSHLDAVIGPETGHEQVQQQDRPVSPVASEYIEDTTVKSFRDDVDELAPAIAAGHINNTAVPAETDNLVPMPLKTRNYALAEDPAVAYDDWETSPDASVDGESRFSSTRTPWDAAHIEHESDDMAAAGLELSDDEDEFHLESTRLRSEPAKRTYDLPSMSPTKSSYDLPSKSPTKSTYDLPSMSPMRSNHDHPSSSRAAEPASVDGYDSRESSEQPSSLDLYQAHDRDESFHEKPREKSTNWQLPEDEESERHRYFRTHLPTSSDMNPANSTVLTDIRGQETVFEDGAYSTDASEFDSEVEAEAAMAAMKRSVTSPTERFDGFVREQTIRVVDEPNSGPKSSDMTPRAGQPTPLLLPRSEMRDAEPSPLALRYSQSSSPTRGLAYSKHNPDRPRTPPEFDPEAFMPKDVMNVPWHARHDSVPVSLRSQSTLDTAASSPVHSALHADRYEPTIRDSWPRRARNDSSAMDDYDPFRDAGAKFPRQTYVPPVAHQSPQRNSMSSVAPGGNNTGSPGSLFHKMRSVFEKPGSEAPHPSGTSASETGSPIKSRPGSGVWPPVRTARPLSDLPDDNGLMGYKRQMGLFNERAEDRDERSGLLRNARSSYEGSGY
ncbi:conserved hypothetical protein [Verticillium alfalfae VaMs.102]|uniref:Uncharacterized protein n=1 Tax=Verticillium alfalfae (strain VaMs.102 / ATCC MYA-4576 / FGSC 10136) TaxID=526221 RepID=C9SUA5_VERA1|nr:conserved hypothetical protein [Verticillium alfalfae VaMs.102]EEY22416.1 conserved hypothetical protein [Verticillium alfalfae VaMs.102]